MKTTEDERCVFTKEVKSTFITTSVQKKRGGTMGAKPFKCSFDEDTKGCQCRRMQENLDCTPTCLDDNFWHQPIISGQG